jgi:hypothetical protein
MVVAGLVALQRRRGHDLVIDWATLILLALLFSPQTTVRHFVLITAVYPVAIAVLLLLKQRRDQIVLVCAIALTVAGLTLPFGTRTSQAVWRWREIGGPSWCALIFLFVLNWVGRKPLTHEGQLAAPSPISGQ